MDLKAKLKEACDKAEAKLEQFGESTTRFINEHPRLILTTTFASFIGLMSWGIAVSMKDMNEHPERYLPKEEDKEDDKYEEVLEKLNSLDFIPGEQLKVIVGENGIKKVIHSYEQVTEETDDEEEELEPGDVEVSRF